MSTMNLSFLKDDGDMVLIEAPVDSELDKVLEKELSISVAEQAIHVDGREVDKNAQISQLGLTENSILSLRRRVERPSVVTPSSPIVPPGSPYRVAFEPVKGAIDIPISSTSCHHCGAINQDEPKGLGEVTMLYVPVEINGHPLKAMIGCSAPYSTISPECAKSCGIMGNLDPRFIGIALGMGPTRIFGRVRASLKVDNVQLDCSLLVVEGYDLLLGLDMLKANHACIDLERGIFRIKGCEVAFSG